MIFDSDPYVMLVASLPAIGLLSEKEPPINRPRLMERLALLSADDRAELDALVAILSWSQVDPAEEDAAFIARAERTVAGLRSPDLRAAVRDRLEIRTLLAALRRRAAGEEAPPAGSVWGFGRYLEQIRANWSAADFGVGRSFPWILAAKDKLESGDTAGLERIVLEAAWSAGTRHEQEHAFDLEAVVFYLLRWSLAERWARYDGGAAAARFTGLLEAALQPNPEASAAA